MTINVNNVTDFYKAVNAASNSGKKIILAAGNYVLDPNNPEVTPGTGGRIELQENMELQGEPGHPELVTIDASKLPGTSFNPPNGFPAARSGAIRMGRGLNTIEWLTVIGNSDTQALSVIDTDLIWNGVSRIRIAHSIITKGRIGINIRNVGAASIDRIIEAELMDNELVNNDVSDLATQQGQGIVAQNANGVKKAIIKVKMSGNNIHQNIVGMRVFNNNANSNMQNDKNSITIESHADKIDKNKLGINLIGGLNRGANSTVNGNTIIYEAHGTSIQNNTGIKPDPVVRPCGILLTGGLSLLTGSDSSNNKIEIKLFGCKISGNENNDIVAFGALSATAIPAGINNIVEIELVGTSKQATLSQTSSTPAEPAGTNQVIIV